ncbi:MAG: AAA family ATPase, partial [Nitrososphaerota archaeon]
MKALVYIKKVEIRGFKSLGGRPVALELSKGLTVITGPNGGGKSNILDAILFCLGQNSPKALRVNKLTSLIFDGSADQERAQSARVTITFDNSSGNLPVDGEEVTLTRELKENGESIYYFNGRKASKSSVAELLGLALVSPEGFNIIPQGFVTRLSELSPHEKRALIEEVAGVAEFDRKKSEALKQLHDADMRLQVALARMDEIRKTVIRLEGERNEALRLKRLSDEVRELKASIISKKLSDVREKASRQRSLLEEKSMKLKGVQEDLSRLKSDLQMLDEERKNFVTNVMDGASRSLLQLRSAIL